MRHLRDLSGQAVIVGFGDAYASSDQPLTPLALASEASFRCLRDAGVERDDVDGLLTGREPFGDLRPQWNSVLAAHLHMAPKHSTQVMVHGAGINAMFKHAMLAVVTGAATHVLCVQSDGGTQYADLSAEMIALDGDPQFELPYGPSMAAFFGMFCRRYMHEFGITEEQLARTSIAHHGWAHDHPQAWGFGRTLPTVDDVIESPMVCSPLRRWMCGPWRRFGTAGAFLVTTAERAADLDSTPIYILGTGDCLTNEYVTDRLTWRGVDPILGQLPTLTTSGAKSCAQAAYEMAGLKPSDMDIVQASSNFAPIAMWVLEDLGFCGKGEAGDFVDDGHIGPDGDLPYNTNGGMMGFGLSGLGVIVDQMVELVRQLRGEALGVQVPASVGLVQSTGGVLSGNSVTILGTEPG